MKTLLTRRCRLEPLRAEHAVEMFPLLSDARLYEFVADEPPTSLAALTKRYRRLAARHSGDGSQQWLNWIIRGLADRVCVGFIQATVYTAQTADFAFLLGSAFWGRGLACEASNAALHALFTDYEVVSLFATVDRRNGRSLSLLARLGFSSVSPAVYPHGDAPSSDQVFQLERNAWPARRGALAVRQHE